MWKFVNKMHIKAYLVKVVYIFIFELKFSTYRRIFMPLQQTNFENVVANGEIAHNVFKWLYVHLWIFHVFAYMFAKLYTGKGGLTLCNDELILLVSVHNLGFVMKLRWYHKKMTKIWTVLRENQHYGLCVMYRPSSACAIRTGYSGSTHDTFRLRGIEV